ncbi:MAG: diaminopimelate decarboxylase [Conexivisphaerales archaeon]
MSDKWILENLSNSFAIRNNELYVEGRSCVQLAEEFGSPLFVTSEKRVRANVRRLKEAFAAIKKFRIYYAVKSNSNLSILRIIRSEGAWADCSCPAEIYEASLCGFEKEKMLYTGNYNSRDELEYALASGVTINFDDASLLEKLNPAKVPETVCFRINPGIGKGGKEGLVFAGPDAKFGSTEEVAAKGYNRAKELGAKKFGIHMMTGSNVLDPAYFSQITEVLLDISGRIAKSVGIEFEFVSIGGGFGVPYRQDERPLPIDKVASDVISVFKERVQSYGLGDPALCIEPGRYIVADSTVLLAKVCHIKHAAKTFVGVDAGMNTLLRPALYGAYHPVVLANRMDAEDTVVVNVCGQICENTDILAKDRPFPKVSEGDIIAIFNAGAYGFSMSSQYNNRPRAAEVLVSESRADLIRRRESISDLLNGQLIPSRLLT